MLREEVFFYVLYSLEDRDYYVCFDLAYGQTKKNERQKEKLEYA
jgi:hypothetical protein